VQQTVNLTTDNNLDKLFCRLMPALLKKLLCTYNLERVAAIQWGVIHEQTAISQYCSMGARVSTTG
jgi:hypothetical protein